MKSSWRNRTTTIAINNNNSLRDKNQKKSVEIATKNL